MSFEKGQVLEGTVNAAYLATDYSDEDMLVIVFELDTPEGAIKARHKCGGDKLEQTKEVVALFGVAWPDVENISVKAPGQTCQVYIGEYQGKFYGKINTGSGVNTSDPVKVERALAILKAGDDDIPF